MKKFALILLSLAVVFPLIAEDVDIADAKVSISGDATTTFGVDLDTQATGFTNTLNAKMRLNFGLAGDMTGSGMDDGDIYGEVKFDEIEIRTMEANNENDTASTFEMDIDLEYAKIIAPTWWISVKAQDDEVDYENASHNGILGLAAVWDKDLNKLENNLPGTGGFEAGVSIPDIANIELSLFSLTDWTSAEDNDADNAYGVKASVGLTAVENLTLDAAINMGFGEDLTTTVAAVDPVYGWLDDMATPADTTDDVALADDTAATAGSAPYWGVVTAGTAATTAALATNMGFGGKVGYAIAVNDDITITPEIALDIQMVDDGMNMAIGNGLKITLPGSEITATEDGIRDDAGVIKAWDDGVDAGVRVGWSYYMPDGADDGQLGIMAHVGLSMVENLQVALGFEADDMMADDGDMALAVYGDYTMGDIKPFGGVYMLLDNEDNGGSDGETIIEAGLTYGLFPHTDIVVQYNSGNMAADDTGDEADPGILTIVLKVKY